MNWSPNSGQIFSNKKNYGAVIAILTVGVEEWILEGSNNFVCLSDHHEVCLSVMDHYVSSAMFLPDNYGRYFRNCRSIVTLLVLSAGTISRKLVY